MFVDGISACKIEFTLEDVSSDGIFWSRYWSIAPEGYMCLIVLWCGRIKDLPADTYR